MWSHAGMPGVECQTLNVHCGDNVVYRQSIDRRDCVGDENYVIDLPHELRCTHLVHFTENQYAELIGLETYNFCFKPRSCPISSNQNFNLTWWSPLPPENWETLLNDGLLPHVYPDLGNSTAFGGQSLCGPVGFAIKWKNILNHYAASRGSSLQDVECRILGTFKYRSEIMYAVLVCING